nr:uncharacterized protein LOC109427924 [Aedes albopictus]
MKTILFPTTFPTLKTLSECISVPRHHPSSCQVIRGAIISVKGQGCIVCASNRLQIVGSTTALATISHRRKPWYPSNSRRQLVGIGLGQLILSTRAPKARSTKSTKGGHPTTEESTFREHCHPGDHHHTLRRIFRHRFCLGRKSPTKPSPYAPPLRSTANSKEGSQSSTDGVAQGRARRSTPTDPKRSTVKQPSKTTRSPRSKSNQAPEEEEEAILAVHPHGIPGDRPYTQEAHVSRQRVSAREARRSSMSRNPQQFPTVRTGVAVSRRQGRRSSTEAAK